MRFASALPGVGSLFALAHRTEQSPTGVLFRFDSRPLERHCPPAVPAPFLEWNMTTVAAFQRGSERNPCDDTRKAAKRNEL